MPKIMDVKDKETGETLQMNAIDAREAVDNGKGRYSMKGYSYAAEETRDVVPRRARPPQSKTRRARTRAQRKKDADLSATAGPSASELKKDKGADAE
jgi:hypothetical protein